MTYFSPKYCKFIALFAIIHHSSIYGQITLMIPNENYFVAIHFITKLSTHNFMNSNGNENFKFVMCYHWHNHVGQMKETAVAKFRVLNFKVGPRNVITRVSMNCIIVGERRESGQCMLAYLAVPEARGLQ